MSTEPTPTPETRTTDAPTAVAARGREDPWTADDAAPIDRDSPARRSQLLFDPRSIARLRNLVDEENAYCS